MMQLGQVTYFNCPYCRGVMGDTQCIPCYERSMQQPIVTTFTNAPLTEADVRRIVREELERIADRNADV